MQLLLSVGIATRSGGTSSHDVVAELEPSTPLRELQDALVAWARELGMPMPGQPSLAVARNGSPYYMDPRLSVLDAGLLTGDHVILGETPTLGPSRYEATPVERGPGLSLDITSGPEGGRTVPPSPGLHVVGRNPDCDVRVNDG